MANMLPVRWIIVFVFACAVLTGLPGAANAQPDITWRVENPFRFFTDSADTARHRATYEALSPGERLNPILSSERQLARRHPDGWAAALSGEVCWDRTTNRHRCPDQKSSYVRPGYHRVEVQLSNLGELAQATCTWLTAPRGRAAGRGMAITQPCAEQLILEVPYPRGVNIEVHATHRLIARKRIVVRDVLIVGFGDSFASGEGNPDMPVRFSPERTADYGEPTDEIQLKGYPARIGSWSEIGDRNFIANNARWLDQACHRSLYSHQLRVALQLAIEDPHRA
ncbi:MAG: hypothetical protein ACR2PA_10650, partial [Hyphomicrobiaceae bacterium]